MADGASRTTPGWLRPPAEQTGLRYYLAVVRERWLLIAAAVVVCLIGAGVYLATTDRVYEAEADILINPAPADDELLPALGVIRASSDPSRDVETAAKFVTTSNVAGIAREELGTTSSATSLLSDVDASPVGTSAIVAITAKASSAQAAADLANAFAAGVITERTRTFHARIDRLLEQPGEASTAAGTLGADAARLQLLRSGPDPTISVAARADPPRSPASPKPKLTLAAAVFAGLVLGIAAAFAAQTLDPRLRREDQLRARYQLPILTRVPGQRSQPHRPLLPTWITPPTREAYRALRANIVAAHWREQRAQCVLVTGSAPSEGKTTTAINLATSLASTGATTILIEADLRRPSIGRSLGVSPTKGVVSTLLENESLRASLIRTKAFGPQLTAFLQLLLADRYGGWTSELFSPAAAERLVREAKELADFVVIDSPPLTAVTDALPLAQQADDVIIVARPGVTRLDKLHDLAEMLHDSGIAPLGFAVIGSAQDDAAYAYYRPDDLPEAAPPGRRRSESRGSSTPMPESRARSGA